MSFNIEMIESIFKKLMERPDKSNEISVIIRDTLNSAFGGDIKCNKVFISNGNDTEPYYLSVIPTKPDSRILTKKFLKEYDIDIDLSSFFNNHNDNGFTAREMTAWLMHEISSNILTDETFLRFKKLIVKYYDTKDSMVLDVIDAYGIMMWIGIFSRTKKEFSTDKLNEVNILLDHNNLLKDWDSALLKYIAAKGGNYNIITDEYNHRMDKVQLRKFNELARKYSSYALKYNNTDYSTMVKYMISSTKSELLKFYISKEPQSVPTNLEKMVFILFDDSKILLESVGNEECIYDNIKIVDISKKIEELALDIKNIKSESDKLLCDAKVKELSRIIDYKFMDVVTGEYKNLLQQMKYNIETLINTLRNKDAIETVSMQELD